MSGSCFLFQQLRNSPGLSLSSHTGANKVKIPCFLGRKIEVNRKSWFTSSERVGRHEKWCWMINVSFNAAEHTVHVYCSADKYQILVC